MLASPRYGERWGRHWLDAARFGESVGAHDGNNAIRDDAYRYRGSVIRVFNDDLPYDEIVRFQVADTPHSVPAKRRDLGMFVQLGTNLSKTDNPNDRKCHRLDDMVSATRQPFLALTVGCARCHDHKIGPITVGGIFELTAVFFEEAEVKPGAGGKFIPLEVTTPHTLAGGRWQRPVRPIEPGFLRVLMRHGRSPADSCSRPEANNGLEGQVESSKRGMLANWLSDVKQGTGAFCDRDPLACVGRGRACSISAAPESLAAHDSPAFLYMHKLVGLDVSDVLDAAVRPVNADKGGLRLAPQPKMQSEIVHG